MAVRRCDQPASNDWYILPQLLCYYIHYLGILGNEKVCGHRVTVPQRGCSCPEPLRGEKAGGSNFTGNAYTQTHNNEISVWLCSSSETTLCTPSANRSRLLLAAPGYSSN